MVAACRLDQHREIMPDAARQRDFRHARAEHLVVAAPAVQALVRRRVGADPEVDHQVQHRGRRDCGVAVEAAGVEDAESAHLDEIPQQGRAVAVHAAVRCAPPLDDVVGNQLVTAAEQFQADFALAGAAGAAQEHAQAFDFEEDAVRSRLRC